jgi:hypothetical protein
MSVDREQIELAPEAAPAAPVPAASGKGDAEGDFLLPPPAPGAAVIQAPGTIPSMTHAKESGIEGWLHRHRWFTKEPITYTLYQFTRSAIAAVPYAFAMAGVHHLMGLLNVYGQKKGLTEEGQKIFTDAVKIKKNGLAELEGAVRKMEPLGKLGEIYKPGTTAMVGRNLMRIANSPMNPALQIAAGFTLFRFTGGIIKNLRDRVMREDNQETETKHEVNHAWKTVKETVKTNWHAESVGTPIAALVLGFMNAAFTPAPESIPIRNKADYPGFKGFKEQLKTALGPKSKLLQNAAVWTFSYSLFFLMAESLFKDIQVRRGLWKGHPNSLKNGPDDTVGGPGAVEYKTPENDPGVKATEKKQHHVFGKKEEKAKDSDEKLKYPNLTGEPSIGRFLFRRVLPVAVGITGYAVAKRIGYLAMGGPMMGMTVERAKELDTFGKHANFFLENAKREGVATSTFGVLWMATDAAGSWYDKMVHQLQKSSDTKPMTPEQQKNHASLLQRLNEKEQSQGRAA